MQGWIRLHYGQLVHWVIRRCTPQQLKCLEENKYLSYILLLFQHRSRMYNEWPCAPFLYWVLYTFTTMLVRKQYRHFLIIGLCEGENKMFSCFWGDHSLRLTGMIQFDYMWECFLEFSLITRTIWFGDKGRCPPWLTTDYLTYPSPPLSLPYGMFPICSSTINQGTKPPLNIIYITI